MFCLFTKFLFGAAVVGFVVGALEQDEELQDEFQTFLDELHG